MSASLNQLLSNTKFKLVIIPIALLTLAVASYLIFSKPSKERLIKNLTALLREEKFEQLYEEADDSVRSNVTKEKFVQRMKIAVAKLKAIDGNLNFQRDMETEESIKKIMKGIDEDTESSLIKTYQKLEKDGKSVLVDFYWTTKGNFFDIDAISTQGTSEEYRVHGVAYKHLYVGKQMVE
ncbi:MAG: hypothetical protein M3261_01475 [Thermoproteota archaeon]|nr:hypothetical protein [Thermoproteota archaeon]